MQRVASATISKSEGYVLCVRRLFLFEIPWLTPLLAYDIDYRGLTSTSMKISKLRFFTVALIETRHATSVLRRR
ncbi:hypothetical protein LJC35_00365 [Parabacteroides sp. OttesenSCG-928-N08]|nr:hypothetical protein [Parabacteroides sp. OttesenSCG-928-N08]